MTTEPGDSSVDVSAVHAVDEFEALARARLSEMAYGYFVGGAGDEHTVRANVAAWDEHDIWPRALVDVSSRTTASRLLGIDLATPMLVAPTALHQLAHPDGELATIRGCNAAGVPMVVSSIASTRLEAICAEATVPVLLQLYIGTDRGFTREFLQRAEAAGCAAIELTVDTPVWGTRRREAATGFHLPEGVDVVNLRRDTAPEADAGAGAGTGARAGADGSTSAAGSIGDVLGWTISPDLTWSDLEWLCSTTSLPVLPKGICRPDDARRAADAGAAGIVVSNHGGRQLDGVPPTARSLPRVVEAVGDRVPVIVDGGIRRGIDVLRALALGARAVQVGRPVLWGLGTAGAAGVQRVLDLIAEEFDQAMALSGCAGVDDVTADLLTGDHTSR